MVYTREQLDLMKEQLMESVDALMVCLPKGEMEKIKQHTGHTEESTNNFVFRAVYETMMRDRATGYKVPEQQARFARVRQIEQMLADIETLKMKQQG